MPYKAAKAVAATFCYSIRYALTPLFGVDFLSLCVLPNDPSFSEMIIDREIVRDCASTARTYRALSKGASHVGNPSIKSSSSHGKWNNKSLRANMGKPADSESGYGTDTDRSDRYLSPSQTPLTMQWTALNTPVSSTQTKASTSSPRRECTSKSKVKYDELPKSSGSDGICNGKRHSGDKDDDFDQESNFSNASDGLRKLSKRRKISSAQMKESRAAAYMLMQMQMADATLGDFPFGSQHRPASS